MKKSLYAVLVIVLSTLGANALAAKFDFNVERVSIETNDKTGNTNGTSDTGGGRNMVTREK